MPRYAYSARDGMGVMRTGIVEGRTESDAVARLRDDELTVTEIRIATQIGGDDRRRIDAVARRVRREEVIAFTDQMAVMLETGVPLSEALDAFLQQTRPGPFRQVTEVVADRITSGLSFSVAISEFPRVFPRLMVSLLEASEAAGALDVMLRRVSDYLASERQTRRQIRGALAYPAVMLTMACAVTTFLVLWVLPRFASIYEARSAALPTPTRVLLGVSGAVQSNGVLILAGLAACVVGFIVFRRSDDGRRLIDAAKVQAPIVGPILKNFYLTRVTRTLATLLDAGVTLPDAIRILKGVVNNQMWADTWKSLEEAITSGRTIGEVVLDSPVIPASVGQMISAGERTGRLPEVLVRVADVTERDFNESVKAGAQMIEPVMIMVMGVMIGGVAVALLLPIFTIGNAVTG
jgi:type IV pilus assembly protein PilC